MKKTRAFVAIPLPQHLKDEIEDLQRELRGQIAPVRWSRLETLHLTLRFFGDCTEEDLEKIGKAMVSIGVLRPSFAVPVIGLGAFPSPARPRVLWLGLRDRGGLQSLYDALEKELNALGIAREERPFRPHLTLGRAKARLSVARSVFDHYRQRNVGILPADRIILYASELHPGGAVHRPIKTVPLGAHSESTETS